MTEIELTQLQIDLNFDRDIPAETVRKLKALVDDYQDALYRSKRLLKSIASELEVAASDVEDIAERISINENGHTNSHETGK